MKWMNSAKSKLTGLLQVILDLVARFGDITLHYLGLISFEELGCHVRARGNGFSLDSRLIHSRGRHGCRQNGVAHGSAGW
jgi:hypothetical protein